MALENDALPQSETIAVSAAGKNVTKGIQLVYGLTKEGSF